MDEELLRLIAAKTRSPDFRRFVDYLVDRNARYEALKERNHQIIVERRAKREGTTVEKIKADSSKAVARYALRDDEKRRLNDNRQKIVRETKDDARLLRMLLNSNQFELDQQEGWLKWKKLPAENRPLFQESVLFLSETRTIIITFAESKGWSTTHAS